MTADIVNFSAYRLRRGLTLPRPADPALVSFYDAVNTVRSPHDANHFRIWRIGIRTLADLASMSAFTLPGLVAKLKVLANDADTLNGPEWTEALIRGAAADAERLAMTGRAAA